MMLDHMDLLHIDYDSTVHFMIFYFKIPRDASWCSRNTY